MYVSAINSVSQLNFIKKNSGVKQQSSPNFKSYASAYEQIYKKIPEYKSHFEAITGLHRLIKELFLTSGHVEHNYLENFKSQWSSIESKLEYLEEKNIYGKLVTKNGRDLLISYGDGVTFLPETQNGTSIGLELVDKTTGDLRLSKNSDSCSDIIEFYKDGGIKMRKHVSGTGLGQTSDTTYYDRDGEERVFRTLLNSIFGI